MTGIGPMHSPRPQQLVTASAELRERVRVHDFEDTYRVYVKSWRPCTQPEFNHYMGRLDALDMAINFNAPGLAVRLWTYVGEWKHREDADAHLAETLAAHPEAVIVGRGTRDEVILKEYGVRRLREADTTGQ